MSYPRHRTSTGGPVMVTPTPHLPELERDTLATWAAEKTFPASVEARESGANGSNEYVFYDGPPFANGLPHYGHLLTGYVKDVVPRYQTMRGRRVERRFGWDCHGLPAEVEAEKQLGISGKPEIIEMGIAKFNEACRASVLRYTEEWERYVSRQARWVDFDNDYKTLDLPYMESVMWAFKTLHDKGLIYEGFRVLPYCWRCETPLSATETRMDDVYRSRQDPASTVWFELETGERVLAWTTMPWTLVPNVALVVGPDIDYAVMQGSDGHRYLLAESRLAAYERELTSAERVDTIRGADLVGRRYTPVFDFLVEQMADVPNAFTVLAGDFVSTEDGTGVVQVAPSHGEDDFNVCAAAGIPVVMTVDPHARFTSLAPRFAGLQVFEANKPLLAELRERGVLYRQDSYEHPYPHCWRCDTPLVYMAVSSWFVEVTRFRDRMVELNQQITWVPAHVRDGSFGKWLEGARDWSISRNRFWGSPIPVWVSDDPNYPRTDVYGSLDEMERDFGVRPTDLHRPYVDDLTRPNPDDPTGHSMMRRVPETLDCWFESGSMPFAQVHYPFENAQWFEDHYPGDFIVEYLAQTRGWFYTLHVLATALFDRPAFRTCVAHGIVLGDDGRKMSKSLRNYPDVYEMYDSYGADAMRWSLMASPILRGGDLSVTETLIRDSVRQAIHPLWNAWYFFGLYANAEAYQGKWRTDSQNLLDRYVLAKMSTTVTAVTTTMDGYDISGACAEVRFFLDALTNWYIRRSRDRFWAGDSDAFDTLYTVLEVTSRLAAPLLPMITEQVWRGLTGQASVHLTDWPSPQDLPADDELVADMDAVRSVASVALSIRKANKVRVRQPLPSLTIHAADAERLRGYVALIADEVNVKAVHLEPLDAQAFLLRPNARALGPRLGAAVQDVIRAARAGRFTENPDGTVTCAGVVLTLGEFELTPAVGDDPGTRFQDSRMISLALTLTAELEAEGLVRDVIRGIQESRREAGFSVSDRIAVRLHSPDSATLNALRTHRELIERETLATDLALDQAPLAEPTGQGGEVRDASPAAGWATYAVDLGRVGQVDLRLRLADQG